MKPKVLLLILTFNRIDKLKKLLNSLINQTSHSFDLLIIDNHSIDQTQEFLSKLNNMKFPFKIYTYRTDINKGSSEGYNFGFQKAIEIGFDWLYVGDDDAYFDKDVISKFLLIIYDFVNCNVFCGSVFDSNHKLDTTHRRNYRFSFQGFKESEIPLKSYNLRSIDIKLFSFVGLFLNFRVISTVGLPNKNYFIWWDDTEYSIRVSKKFSIKLIPEIRFYHDTQKSLKSKWKVYYGIRNRLYTIKKFSPWWVILIEELKHLFKMLIFLFLFKKDKFKLYFFSYIDYKYSKLGVNLREFN
jgi:GT2 family glycosyltransferase